MVRMGHANPRAALIYQHATDERDKAIAGALSGLAGASRTPHLRSVPHPSDEGGEDPGWGEEEALAGVSGLAKVEATFSQLRVGESVGQV